MSSTPVNVLISGAAGNIGYALIPLFATGLVFGPDKPMNLRLLDIPPMVKKMKGVEMELRDGAYPLLKEIICTADYDAAFRDVDYCVLVGGFPRKKGMVRADLVGKNAPIFRDAGLALQRVGKTTTKVLVVANPANTNALICSKFAPKIPKKNFCALTRLDMNRAQAQVAERLGVDVVDLKNIVIWGNHSNRQVPDITYGTVLTRDSYGLVQEKRLTDVLSSSWLPTFVKTVQQRGKSVIEMRGLSSAMSAANAAKDCLRDWVNGTQPGEHVAMAVYSDGTKYGVPEGVFYSFPCTCENGEWTIVNNLPISPQIRRAMIGQKDEASGFESSLSQLQDEQTAAFAVLDGRSKL